MNYRIFPPSDLVEVRLTLPLSKSMSNRALLISALTPGAALPTDVALCDDTDIMVAALTCDDATTSVDVGAAGTAMRFLTAYFASIPGKNIILTGSERMLHRPIGPLVDALRQCGASIDYTGEEGFPPLYIKGSHLAGGTVTIDPTTSSQFISALMMIAPMMDNGLTIKLTDDPVSASYIRLTASMMRRAGAEVEMTPDSISVAAGGYTSSPGKIESDWSAASYWYEIEALTSGFVTIDNLYADSAQGDRRVADIYEQLGVCTLWEGEDGGTDLQASPEFSPRLNLDLTDNPDIAQSIAVTCAMIGIPFNLTGVATLRLKETDRIEALRNELLKVGVVIDTEIPGQLSWDGTRRPVYELPEFDTYNDHRMAMSLAPVAIYFPGIVIRGAEVVSKSYPGYWADLHKAGFVIVDGDIPLDQLRRAEEAEE